LFQITYKESVPEELRKLNTFSGSKNPQNSDSKHLSDQKQNPNLKESKMETPKKGLKPSLNTFMKKNSQSGYKEGNQTIVELEGSDDSDWSEEIDIEKYCNDVSNGTAEKESEDVENLKIP